MKSSNSQDTVTLLLKEAGNGNESASDQLFDLAYNELRELAHNKLKGMNYPDTIHTTALVHEVYLKLFDHGELQAENKVHFFALCGKVMRQILVDYYRKKTAAKRGGALPDKTLNEQIFPETDRQFELLDLDLALTKLNRLSSRLCTVVECKFFAAMNDDEIALYLGVTDRTVRNDWRKARMWLSRELSTN
jgi:RNA polymerase sigma factor (TIGR02999 family)